MKHKIYMFGIIIAQIILIGIVHSVTVNSSKRNWSDYAKVKIQENTMLKGSENDRTDESVTEKKTLVSDTFEMIEDCDWIYDHWTEFLDEKNIPYVDDKTFQIIKNGYAEIEFYGEFKKGNMDVDDFYKKI